MKSDRYNNEGYADPTAYHAIESADKPNPGELWSMELANGEQRQCIVLSSGENTAVTLCLIDERRDTWLNGSKSMKATMWQRLNRALRQIVQSRGDLL